jgi:hypothetical protein
LDAPSTITTHADGTNHIETTEAATASNAVGGGESSPTAKGVVKGDGDAAAADKQAAQETARTIRFVGEQHTASGRIKGDNTIATTTAGGIIPARTTVPAHWTAQGSRRRLRTVLKVGPHDDDHGPSGETDSFKNDAVGKRRRVVATEYDATAAVDATMPRSTVVERCYTACQSHGDKVVMWAET